jgi:DNA-binding transcriptional ArsR family regulator
VKISEASNALESLGNESRLSIFRVLVRAGPAGLPVGKLQQRLHIPGSTLSHHISHLVNCQLVLQRREGRIRRCTVNYARMNALMAYLVKECCQDVGGC